MLASAKHPIASSNLSTIERAKTMGIRVITPNAIHKWSQRVEQLKTQQSELHQKLQTTDERKNTSGNTRTNPSKRKTVTLKVEDNSKLYQPELKVLYNGFPQLDYSSPGFGSPFDQQGAYNLRSNKTAHPNTCKLTAALETEAKRVYALEKENDLCASGYCEMCHVQFTNKSFHLRGRVHRLNIETKYDGLDRLINDPSQCSFDLFIRHHGDDHEQEEKESQIPSSEITVSAISPIQLSVRYVVVSC